MIKQLVVQYNYISDHFNKY